MNKGDHLFADEITFAPPRAEVELRHALAGAIAPRGGGHPHHGHCNLVISKNIPLLQERGSDSVAL